MSELDAEGEGGCSPHTEGCDSSTGMKLKSACKKKHLKTQ